jgi:hypothetical protein
VVKFLVEQWPEGMRERDKWLLMPLHLVVKEGETEVVIFFGGTVGSGHDGNGQLLEYVVAFGG